MPNNILVTGSPRVGKTTLIKKIINRLSHSYVIGGFYTHEKRESGKRTGFYITDFSGNQMIIADVNSNSPYRVGKYGVNVEAFEKIGVPALEDANENADLVIIDEIGKMEMFSQKFCKMLERVFDSQKPVLATIKKTDCELTSRLKSRDDVVLFQLTVQNRDVVEEKLLALLENVLAKN